MTELERLRASLTDEQRKILTAIWSYFREHKEWIPVRLLHNTFGGKAEAWASLNKLGGTIVFEDEERSQKYYQLTFLGILLTEDGPDYERLLVLYLKYVSQKSAEEPTRTQISSNEVAADLKLDPEQLPLLGFLILEGHFSSGSSWLGEDAWYTGIPDDVEDFPSDIVEYVQTRATENCDPESPTAYTERLSYFPTKTYRASFKEVEPESVVSNTQSDYVDKTRLDELRAISSRQFDLTRLIKLCEELNTCSSNQCYLATVMLTRALLDHVAPIFDVNDFSAVANTYKGSRSFKASMQYLDNSCKKIADENLHIQIRSKEILPNETQVNFSNGVDVLLGEIVRILKPGN